jgi:hypothetical protein
MGGVVRFLFIFLWLPLTRVCSFVAIAAGKNHLLAITSKGRTYGLPVNKAANEYGQLGFRRFDIPDPASTITHNAAHLHVELVPKSLLDPYRKSSRAIRAPSAGSSPDNILSNVDDTSIRFCPTIFEIPVLQGVDVAQVAAGGRSSFARTTDGRVLGWGANEYGYVIFIIECSPCTKSHKGKSGWVACPWTQLLSPQKSFCGGWFLPRHAASARLLWQVRYLPLKNVYN